MEFHNCDKPCGDARNWETTTAQSEDTSAVGRAGRIVNGPTTRNDEQPHRNDRGSLHIHKCGEGHHGICRAPSHRAPGARFLMTFKNKLPVHTMRPSEESHHIKTPNGWLNYTICDKIAPPFRLSAGRFTTCAECKRRGPVLYVRSKGTKNFLKAAMKKAMPKIKRAVDKAIKDLQRGKT